MNDGDRKELEELLINYTLAYGNHIPDGSKHTQAVFGKSNDRIIAFVDRLTEKGEK